MPGKLKSVFFLYRQVKVFTKTLYKQTDKRSLKNLFPYVFSEAGFDGAELQVPVPKGSATAFRQAGALIISDAIPVSEENTGSDTLVHFMHYSAQETGVEIFTIRKTGDKFELWLNYSGNKPRIGLPVRDDFFIMNLEKHKPAKILVNGTLKERGNMEPVYFEHSYIIEYHGEYPVRAVKELKGHFKRRLPLDSSTEISLRKLFY